MTETLADRMAAVGERFAKAFGVPPDKRERCAPNMHDFAVYTTPDRAVPTRVVCQNCPAEWSIERDDRGVVVESNNPGPRLMTDWDFGGGGSNGGGGYVGGGGSDGG